MKVDPKFAHRIKGFYLIKLFTYPIQLLTYLLTLQFTRSLRLKEMVILLRLVKFKEMSRKDYSKGQI